MFIFLKYFLKKHDADATSLSSGILATIPYEPALEDEMANSLEYISCTGSTLGA